MAGTVIFANNPSTTVAVNGYNGGASTGDAPASLTAETWTVTSSAQFPTASNTAVPASSFNIADQAAPTELIQVSNVASTTWTLIRGVEGTTPVTHAAGATFYQVVSAGDLAAMKQATGATVAGASVSNTASETLICTYQPVTGEVAAGASYTALAYGAITTASAVATAYLLTWRLRWGGIGGTIILAMATGTNCPSLITSIAAGSSFDVNAAVTFLTTTSCVGKIDFWWQKTTVSYTGVNAASAGVTVSGAGPLVLTAQWGTANASNVLTIPAPLIYRSS